MKAENRKDWQADPNEIKTTRVQMWTVNGTMGGLVTREKARDLVTSRRAFVVTDQAIGICES